MLRLRLIGLAVCLAATVVIYSFQAGKPVQAEPVNAAQAKSAAADAISNRPFGIDKRVPWTTSRFRGRPEPPLPYRAERMFPKINFKNPTVLTSAPGTDRFFVAEQAGKIFSLPNDQSAAAPDLFLNTQTLADRLAASEKQQLVLDAVYGMTFHPKFVENRYCYVCYVVRYQDTTRGQRPDGTRVVRLTVSNSNPPVADPESETLMFSWLQGGHNGGCLKFGPDGFLYISSGDGDGPYPPDSRLAGQDVSNVLSAILRIDVDHPQEGRPYTIPADNPFVSLNGARGEVWAYGLRNPWKMSFDRQMGDLWVGDVGWELWEMVYRVHKADNFGWSLYEGPQPVHTERPRGPTPIVPPTIAIPHTDGASVTGGFVYRGKKYPKLVGTYLFGDWETRRVWGTTIEGDQIGPRLEVVEPTVRVVDFAEDNDGELYLLDYDDGTIHAVVENNVPAEEHPFPRRLSETGIFESVSSQVPAAGVLSFAINAEQWSDGASGERFIGVPQDGAVRLYPGAKPIPGSMFTRAIEFPRDSVLVKTLALESSPVQPTARRRIETQILHFDGRDWRGYSYEWNDEQTDATLVESAGKSRTFALTDAAAPGGKRQQTWRYASRTECLRCHNPWSENALAFHIPQINRDRDFGGVTDNQIRTFRHIGLLEEPGDGTQPPAARQPPKSPETLPRYVDPRDSTADINQRGRTYLHVNCAHCHRNGGGGSAYCHLLFDLPLHETRSVGMRPTQGTFGIHDAKIIAPGDPFRSVLYFRMAKLGPGHMPHIGSGVVDQRGLDVIYDWIQQLPVRVDDQSLIVKLAALDESAAAARDAEELTQLRSQLARQVAAEKNRKDPLPEDEQEAEKRAAAELARRQAQRAVDRPRVLDELLANPSRAALLARNCQPGRLSETLRKAALETALKHADAAVRDLFETFLPEEQRVKRLGEIIKPGELLKLAGNLDQGRELFHKTAGVQCRNCHRIAGDGTELGPDLSQIGKKLNREKLLESVLEPSKNIEPQFVTWVIETIDGKVITGLLVRKDQAEIVVKDAQNKQHRFATSDIEEARPQQKSLMPELLLRELTAQQVADLLAYLESLK